MEAVDRDGRLKAVAHDDLPKDSETVLKAVKQNRVWKLHRKFLEIADKIDETS